MRILLSNNKYSTTPFFDDTYYINSRSNETTGPSVVLIVGLSMAFVGATILIIIICCVCRKRQPPESQGAVYERAATHDGQVTSYPLGPVSATSTPPTQSTTVVSSQMSTTGPPMQVPPHMYGNHPGHQPYPGYAPHPANMGPPYIYPVPQPTQPMTTLAVFGAPDASAPTPATQMPTQQNSPSSLPYPMYATQDTLRSQHIQEYNRQPNMGIQQYGGPQFMSEVPRQATAPPPPAPL